MTRGLGTGVSLGMRWLLVGSSVLLAGCDIGAGPCIHTFEEPILRITDARDATTNQAINTVLLTNVRVGGIWQAPALLMGKAERAAARGDTLECTVPCAFATLGGPYRFEVQSPGYFRDSVAIEAQYRSFDGGCPSSSRGSTQTSVRLTRRPADSARVSFGFYTERVSTLTSGNVHVVFDDGSGPRLARPSQTLPTRTSGPLHIVMYLIDGDTLGRGDLTLDLRPDWIWGATIAVAARNPYQNTCIGCFGGKAFPIVRKTPSISADSFYITWGGNWISRPVIY